MNQNLAIGTKVKHLRTQQKLTLKQLSAKTGLSTGFLSQLERGISAIAIDSLSKVAKSLNVELSSFFQPETTTQSGPVLRNFEQRFAQMNPRIAESVLSQDMLKYNYLPRLFQLMPSESATEPPAVMYSHEGEELLYVLDAVYQRYGIYHVSRRQRPGALQR